MRRFINHLRFQNLIFSFSLFLIRHTLIHSYRYTDGGKKNWCRLLLALPVDIWLASRCIRFNFHFIFVPEFSACRHFHIHRRWGWRWRWWRWCGWWSISAIYLIFICIVHFYNGTWSNKWCICGSDITGNCRLCIKITITIVIGYARFNSKTSFR